MIKTATGKLDTIKIEMDEMSYSNVVMVSGGYPEAYEKGKKITGLNKEYESTILHAGTKKQNNNIITNGGRVLWVISKGEDFRSALRKSYKTIESIDFEGKFFRKDLGFDL